MQRTIMFVFLFFPYITATGFSEASIKNAFFHHILQPKSVFTRYTAIYEDFDMTFLLQTPGF